ncbi:MAG: hypothetical protein WCY25_03425 [Moheibacter sp.]
MKSIFTLSLSLFFFLGISMLFSQETTAQKGLLKRANKNYGLLSTNPKKAFIEAGKIEKEAQQINAKEAELRAIEIKYAYYEIENDFTNMIVFSKYLFQKAQSYKMPVYQTIAKIHLADTYLYNKISEKALQELNEATEISISIRENDSLGILAKSNLFIAFSDYYSLNGECDKVIEYIQKSIAENVKISNDTARQKLQYVNYANLASAFMSINHDSAEYYAKLSLSISDTYERDDVELLNLSILGEISKNKEDYEKALSYFKEAEKLKGHKHPINYRNLYSNIIELYKELNDYQNVKVYKAKRDSLKLNISEKQNIFLHKLLNEKKEGKTNIYIYILSILLLFMLIFILLIIRKNRILSQQEKTSQKYLEEVVKDPKGEDYSKLLKALREKDPAFMFYFDETFPEFSSRLLEINPKITQAEIEFCTLLKLKIQSKDIAKYKNLAYKTAQNKKYIIRKKLNIPKHIDLYQWFEGV